MFSKCPFKKTFRNRCTHINNEIYKHGKSHCIYKNVEKCPLYQEWLAKSKKVPTNPLKRARMYGLELD